MQPDRGPEFARAQRLCTLSMLASVVIMLVGIVWGFRVGYQAIVIEHPLEHIRDNVTVLRAQVQQLEARPR